MSPQIKEALKRAAILAVWAVAPVVVALLTELSMQTGGTVSILFVAIGRVVEGELDARRARAGKVIDADVGAYLPPKGSAPFGALQEARFRDTTTGATFDQRTSTIPFEDFDDTNEPEWETATPGELAFQKGGAAAELDSFTSPAETPAFPPAATNLSKPGY